VKILAAPKYFYPRGWGSEKSAMQFVKACRAKGNDVIVVTCFTKDAPSFEVIEDIPVYRMNFAISGFRGFDLIKSLFPFFLNFLRLLKITFRFKPDVIYVHVFSENAIMVSLLSYLYKCSLIVSPRGFDRIFYNNHKNIMGRLFQRLLNKAQKISFASEALLLKMKKETPCFLDSNKVRIVPNAIDLKSFDEKTGSFALPNGKQYIFSCGRFVFDKGFDILLKAWGKLTSAYPGIDLLIAGDGEERIHLESLADSLGLSERVSFLGFIPPQRVISYYRGCLFFITPSRFEPFGNVVLEAMAASKAVIGSDGGGTVEVIKDGFNGLLFKSGNDQMLAEKMKGLIENGKERDLLGINARRFVEQNYTPDIFSARIEKLIA